MKRPAVAGALLAVCASALPAAATAEEVCHFADDRITESSGLVPAHGTDRVLFTHNDSGDEARFFAVDDTCRTLATYVLPGVDAVDWEDMASGPGPDGRQALWFGDIGDNAMTRAEISVQRVLEPPASRRGARTVSATEFRLAYEDGAHDAETLLADPVTGRLLVVTKTYAGVAQVYAAPEELVTDDVNVLTRVGEVLLPPSGTDGGPVGPVSQLATTGGDVAPDGSRVVVRTYTDAYEWEIGPAGLPAALTLTAPSGLHRSRPQPRARRSATARTAGPCGSAARVPAHRCTAFAPDALTQTREGAGTPSWSRPLRHDRREASVRSR